MEEHWRHVDLPHTWNRFDATDNIPGYRRGTSWYRKEIETPTRHNSFVYRLYFEGANISSEVYVNGKLRKAQKIALDLLIRNPHGEIVSQARMEKRLNPGETKVHLKLPMVEQPMLWAPNDPNLYNLQVTAKSAGQVDEVYVRFGYRWFEFRENGPFFINGKRLLLRGTHRHEDYAGYANAMPDSLHRKDMKMIKEMGANFVRLAHYPQDPEVYRSCDELGLLVWDELPWCRGGLGGEQWKDNTKRLLREQIEQNYNHPCIILWSLGNEMYWLPDFENGDQPDSLLAFDGLGKT